MCVWLFGYYEYIYPGKTRPLQSESEALNIIGSQWYEIVCIINIIIV